MNTFLLQSTGESLTQKELLNKLKEGMTLNFDNEKFCETFAKDDFRGGQVQFKSVFGRMEFVTTFNGVVNHSSKGFTSCLKNLNRLSDKFGCEFTEFED